MTVEPILTIFAQYGFKKASMEDLAKAAEISRQALYKRHKNKEGVFDWAIHEFMEGKLEEIRHCLKEAEHDPRTRLASAFSLWVGQQVPMLRNTPHGMELLDRAIATMLQKARNVDEEFYEILQSFCVETGLCPTREKAVETVFALSMASKGLMLKAETSQAFDDGMQRILVCILGDA